MTDEIEIGPAVPEVPEIGKLETDERDGGDVRVVLDEASGRRGRKEGACRVYLCQRYSTHPLGPSGASHEAVLRARAFIKRFGKTGKFYFDSPVVGSEAIDSTPSFGRADRFPPDYWYASDLDLLKRCDVVVAWEAEVNPAVSVGVANEVKYAGEVGVPVVVVPTTARTPEEAAVFFEKKFVAKGRWSG